MSGCSLTLKGSPGCAVVVATSSAIPAPPTLLCLPLASLHSLLALLFPFPLLLSLPSLLLLLLLLLLLFLPLPLLLLKCELLLLLSACFGGPR